MRRKRAIRGQIFKLLNHNRKVLNDAIGLNPDDFKISWSGYAKLKISVRSGMKDMFPKEIVAVVDGEEVYVDFELCEDLQDDKSNEDRRCDNENQE